MMLSGKVIQVGYNITPMFFHSLTIASDFVMMPRFLNQNYKGTL